MNQLERKPNGEFAAGQQPPAHKAGCNCFRCSRTSPNKGKKASAELRARLSAAHKGQHSSPATQFQKGLRPWNKGTKGVCVPWNKGGESPGTTNEKHPLWKGDAVSYDGLHKWVKRKLGSPKECVFCGESEKKIEWANIDHSYRRDLDDWLPLCRSCHRKYDLNAFDGLAIFDSLVSV